MKPWLKAGLMGGLFLGAFTMFNTSLYLLPGNARSAFECCLCFPMFFICPAIGMLAAYGLRPPRTVDQGARAGARAGLVAGLIDGGFSLIQALALTFLDMNHEWELSAHFSSTVWDALNQSGRIMLFSPALVEGVAPQAPVCGILFFIVWTMVWGAVGGFLFAAIKRE